MMKLSAEQLANLFLKKMSGLISPDEELLLEEWKAASPIHRSKYEEYSRLNELTENLQLYSAAEESSRDVVAPGVHLKPADKARPAVVHIIGKWRWAAAIVLFFSVGAYLYITTSQPKATPFARQNAGRDHIMPGGERATLTLSDGTIIMLDTVKEGNIAIQGFALVRKTGAGEIRYAGKENTNGQLMMNTMATPRGGQYKLVLPDGSIVWLNASSSIRFPAFFNGLERKVELQGEAYFEVAANKQMPFKVKIPGGRVVEVLGTSFNINAYDDEPSVVTTLTEGSIKFISSADQAVLQPGQQIVSATSGKLRLVSKADTEGVLAWKNGYFNFRSADLRAVMRQIARWYDVTIHYEGKLPDMKFTGEISRANELSVVLQILEANKIHCQLDGRQIRVSR